MGPVETVPGMERRGGIRENDGGGEFNITYLIYCDNVPPTQ
jgi:hypothetical protein